MRELSIVDLDVVAGGEYSAGDMVAIGAALGGGIGLSVAASLNLSANSALMLAGIGSAALGGGTAAGIVGWAIGNGLNETTPIQKWLGDMLDKLNQSSVDGDS